MGASQCGEVSASAESLADIFSKSANVSATTDVGANFELGAIVFNQVNLINLDLAGGSGYGFALASEFIGALTIDFDGGKGGYFLADFTCKFCESGFDLRFGRS